MTRLLITYSLSYDWLVNGRPEGDWRPRYDQGLAYQEAARAAWEPHDKRVFEAFQTRGLTFWEAWPAYPVTFPDRAAAFKEPLTFPMTRDWEEMFSVLVHELCHLHEDHPTNNPRYRATLDRVRAVFPNEEESVQYHLVTCALQQAVLRIAFPDSWERMVDLSKGDPTLAHPALTRTWRLLEIYNRQIDWRDPWGSLAALSSHPLPERPGPTG